MKKLLLWLTLPLLFVGCTAELESKYSELESRVAKLETLCSQLNTNISSLQTIVSALQNNDYVTSVSPIMKGSDEIGYTIAFTKSKPITIYHGKNGADGKDGTNGKDGKDGQTPVIGVKADTDGLYYWTLNGEWLLDASGKKIRAIGTDGKDGQNGADGKDGQNGTNGQDGKDGITPQLKIVDGYWQISYDNGKTWTQLGKATGDNGNDGDSFFQNVDTSNPDYVRFTLADGTTIQLPSTNGIVSQIKTIKYVPGYSDNISYVVCMGTEKTLEMTFFINPTEIASQIATSWESMLKLEVVYNTITRAVETTVLDIQSVEESNGYLQITASGDKLKNDFINGNSGASACLKIEKDGVMLSSDYIQILPKIILPKDLSENGTANSYIVPGKGLYKFKTVKGNSLESVGAVKTVEVLWETFGTDTAPAVGDLVKNVTTEDGYIKFEATDKKGNASIAAKDASGKVLWSWHIWMTNQPEEQVYYNNAGTMMDRNLGATSATPGDVKALGLMYQWGRKDPFMGSNIIKPSSTKAASTLKWPRFVQTGTTTGTIAYAQEHPTTFISRNGNYYDWLYYSSTMYLDITRWQSTKTIYDPCPPGWRVPDGGENGVWLKALGSEWSSPLFDSTNKGFDFSGKFGSSSIIWYPATGELSADSGAPEYTAIRGKYWATLCGGIFFKSNGDIDPSYHGFQADGRAIRCCKETATPSQSSATNLSTNGTANSYIVSKEGQYKFKTTQGNSIEPVVGISSVTVLWETFGTDTAPVAGDLIKNVSYEGGYITFDATDKKGNASIAAKDRYNKILWSWHIWMTDQPEEQVYYNDAGTMMDRNLGATSATPGDIEALGLLYQWGRKDPFLGCSSTSYGLSSDQAQAASTLTWLRVSSTSSRGTIAYAQEHPTTFIYSSTSDWLYGSSNNSLWQSTKTIYDPCPPGWRVPDGGSNGVWSKAAGTSDDFDYPFDSTNKVMNFSGKFGETSMICYPTAGYLGYNSGKLYYGGHKGFYWSATASSGYAYAMYFGNHGNVTLRNDYYRADGLSVRCCKE